MKKECIIKRITRFVVKQFLWPLTIFRSNKNDINWHSRFDETRTMVSNFVVAVIGLITFISALFTIPYLFNLLTMYMNIIIVIGQILLIIFFLFSVIGGLFRVFSYNHWLKNEHDRISLIINGISDSEKRAKYYNLIKYGKTIELLKADPDIFKEISPPHLWNSYHVTQLYVIISIIGIAISVLTLIN